MEGRTTAAAGLRAPERPRHAGRGGPPAPASRQRPADPARPPSLAVTSTPRVDALAKVRGEPIYAADRSGPEVLHAVFAVSSIAKGRISALDTEKATAVQGVRLVATHEDTKELAQTGLLLGGGHAFQSFSRCAPSRSPTAANPSHDWWQAPSRRLGTPRRWFGRVTERSPLRRS
jgi:hypothetical protein